MVLNCIELAPAPRTAVPVREFAAHLRLSDGFREDRDDDAVLEMYLRAATAAIEASLGVVLITRPMALRVAVWSSLLMQTVPVGPVGLLEEVALLDADGSRAVEPVDAFALQSHLRPVCLTRRDGGCLPTIPDGGFAEIRFSAGYGLDATDVPPDLRQAVHLLATHYFENRESGAAHDMTMPMAVRALLQPYRLVQI
jgi:uncharacterized phiE125 gp8 family phage protein